MAIEPKIAFLRSELAKAQSSFDAKRKANKQRAFGFKLTVTGLGVLTTVLLGLKGLANETLFQNAALVLSAAVTLFSAWDTFFNHRGLWVRYTQTFTELKRLESQLDYLVAGGTPAEAEVDRLFAHLQDTLTNTDKWWQNQRQDPGTGK